MKEGSLYFSAARLKPVIRRIFRLRCEGMEQIPQNGKFLVCCNHRSVLDPVLLALPFPRQVHYMAKSELFTDHGSVFRKLLLALGAFPVRRNKGDLTSIRTAEDILNGGGIVGIFPQGGCFSEVRPVLLKAGAARIAAGCGAPILPAAILSQGVPRPFRRTLIRFGQLISFDRFPFKKDGSVDIRRLTEELGAEINRLLEVEL